MGATTIARIGTGQGRVGDWRDESALRGQGGVVFSDPARWYIPAQILQLFRRSVGGQYKPSRVVDPGQMQPETALEELEMEMLTIGQEIIRRLLKSEWEEVDRLLVEQYQWRFSPSGGEV
jgi:hypothetical protein